MLNRYLTAAAFALSLAPAAASAQSAMSDPAVPGSGYRIAEVHAGQSTQSANDADLSKPGDGYRIAEVHTATKPMESADDADLSVPGDGYRIN